MDKLIIEWSAVHIDDESADRPDERDEGFWPSLDRTAAGWVGDNPEIPFGTQMELAKDRLAEFDAGEWNYIGVRAQASLRIPCGQNSYRLMTVESAGLWGIESDSDAEYLASVFADERETLKRELLTLGCLLALGEIDERIDRVTPIEKVR